jgi:hypothetical protein
LSNISIELAFEEILENQTKQLWKDASPPYFFSLPLKEHTVQSKCEGDQRDDPQSILFGDEEDIEFIELLDNIDFHIESEPDDNAAFNLSDESNIQNLSDSQING